MTTDFETQPFLGQFEAEPMKHPPYHLRTNKAVDRLLLVEVLRKLGPSYEGFTYYTLGGPFLEDLKVIDHFFPEMKLVSLEANQQTYLRQKFNKFNSRIELINMPLSDFLTHNYKPGTRDVFWLDYTDLKYERFEEFQRVIKQVAPGSVVRITLHAEAAVDLASVEERLTPDELARVQKELEDAFRKEFDLLLMDFPEGGIFARPFRFARMVQLMVRRAASLALDTAGSKVDFLPVQSTRYNDNTQMLSVTGVVCLRTERDALQSQLANVRFANLDWHEPDRIDIPALSIKERLHLERHLPVPPGQDAGETLFRELNYKIDNGERQSKEQLLQYALCHREYPNFIRITV